MAKRGSVPKLVVWLTLEERTQLENMIRTGSGAAYRLSLIQQLVRSKITVRY